ncbi:MAG: hypothetical protein AAB655_01400, partial [Patescibacteria group bacterium]
EKDWLKRDFFQKHKFSRSSHNLPIVVDFLYHPEAAFWFDHHLSTFKRRDWRKSFRTSKYHNWDPEYDSCCHLVLDALKNKFGYKPPRYLVELARWLDIIDGFNYKSAKQVINMKEPALQFDAFVDSKEKRNSGTSEKFIKILSEQPVRKIILRKDVRKVLSRERRVRRKTMDFYGKNIQIFGNISFIDISESKLPKSSVIHYYLSPGINYSLTLSKRESGLFHVTFASNPWAKNKNKTNLGNLFVKYGGGGHRDIGATDIKSLKSAKGIIMKVIDKFR